MSGESDMVIRLPPKTTIGWARHIPRRGASGLASRAIAEMIEPASALGRINDLHLASIRATRGAW